MCIYIYIGCSRNPAKSNDIFRGGFNCVTQQTCLLCNRAPFPRDPTQNRSFVSQEGGRQASHTSDTKTWYNTYKIYIARISGLVSLEGMPAPPATQNHGFVSQTKALDTNILFPAGSRNLLYARS